MFWRVLAHDGDLNTLPDIVATIEKHEKKAEEVYKRVCNRKGCLIPFSGSLVNPLAPCQVPQ
jgi:hypothetical protein